MAKGEYIGFVDSDDFIEPNMFEKLYVKSKEEDLDIIMCKLILFDDKTKKHIKMPYYSLEVLTNFNNKTFNHFDTKDVSCSISVTPPNKIYKTKFLKDNNIKFAEGLMFEDEVFFYEIYLRAKKVHLLDEYLYYYRINNASVMKGEDKDFTDIITIFKLIIEKMGELGYLHLYKIHFSNRYLRLVLKRLSQTSEIYKNKFYHLMREEFENLIVDEDVDEDSCKININDIKDEVKVCIQAIFETDDYEEFELLRKLNQVKLENKKLKNKREKLETKREKLENKQKEILNSMSWKITQPLRVASNTFRK